MPDQTQPDRTAPIPVPVPTRYVVSLLPEDDANASIWTIELHRRPGDRWVVRRGERFYDQAGAQSFGFDSDTEDPQEWKSRFCHSWDNAVALAQRLATTVSVGGFTAQRYLQEEADHA